MANGEDQGSPQDIQARSPITIDGHSILKLYTLQNGYGILTISYNGSPKVVPVLENHVILEIPGHEVPTEVGEIVIAEKKIWIENTGEGPKWLSFSYADIQRLKAESSAKSAQATDMIVVRIAQSATEVAKPTAKPVSSSSSSTLPPSYLRRGYRRPPSESPPSPPPETSASEVLPSPSELPPSPPSAEPSTRPQFTTESPAVVPPPPFDAEATQEVPIKEMLPVSGDQAQLAGTEYDIGDFEEKTPSEPFDLSSFEAGTPILPSAPSTPSPLTPANLDDFVVEGGKLKSDPKIEAAVEKTRKRRIGLAGRLKERFGRKQPAKRQSEKEPEKEPEGEPTYALEGNTLNVTWPNGVTKSTTIHAPDYIELMIVTTDITFQSMEKGYENQEVLKIKLKGSDNFQNIWYAPEYKGLISLSPPAGSRLSEKGLRLNKLSNGDFKVELIKKAPLVSRRTILGGAAALTVAAIAERIYKAIENTTDEDKPAKDKTQETPQPQPQSQQPSQAPQPTQPPQPQPPQQEKAQTKADLDQSPSGAKITFKTLQEGIDGGYLKLLPSGNPVTTRGFKWASNRPFSKDNPETFAVIKQ